MFQFTKKEKYSPKRRWEQPMKRVEYDEQTGQVYNVKQTKTLEVVKDGLYNVFPDANTLLDKVVVNVEVDKQDVELYAGDIDASGGDIVITPDEGKVIGRIIIHDGTAPSSSGGSSGTEGGTDGTDTTTNP